MISTRNVDIGTPADIASRFSQQQQGDINNTGANAVGKTLQLYPWWLYKPPQGNDIVVLAQNNFVAGGSVVMANSTTVLDPNYMGIIRGVDIYINTMTAASILSFGIQVNANPVPGYGIIQVFPRAASSVSMSFDTFIYVPAGGTISIAVTNTDGAAYLVGAGYQGWAVPINIDTLLGVDGGLYTGAP